MAVVLRRNGEIVYSANYKGVDINTPMNTASCSKWLAAATVMALVDEDLLSLDTPISTYVPTLKGPKGNLTIRQLLSHTSGLVIRSSHNTTPDPISCEDPLKKPTSLFSLARVKYRTKPRFCYGNVSFQILDKIAESVAGLSWPHVFHTRIAAPTGMKNTWYAHYRTPCVAGGASSTAADYSLFLEMFRNGGVALNGTRVLSRESVMEMRKNHTVGLTLKCVPHPSEHKQSYGLGLWRGEADPISDEPFLVSHFGHSGFKGIIDYCRDLTASFAVKFKQSKAKSAKRRFRQIIDLIQEIVPAGVTCRRDGI